jgi:hypothetical protein
MLLTSGFIPAYREQIHGRRFRIVIWGKRIELFRFLNFDNSSFSIVRLPHYLLVLLFFFVANCNGKVANLATMGLNTGIAKYICANGGG